MSKKNIILLHVFTWLFGAFLNLRDFSLLSNPEPLAIFLASTLFLAIPFYLFYSVLIPKFFDKKQYYLFFLSALISIAFLPFAGYSLLLLIKAIFSQNFENFYGIYSLKMHFSGLSVVTIAAIFGSFFKIMLNWLNYVSQREILEKEKVKSELELLKSKVNPHFLFNTLNNIDALIYHDPDKASQSLLKLSEIMRYMSYETVSEYVNLSKEIGYINNIVELHKLRISNPDQIKIDIPSDYPALKVAPMLFSPFIENAFKYATFKGANAGVEIKFKIEDSKVYFTVSNHYDINARQTNPKQGGTGLLNVKQRLEHIYKSRYWLDIIDQNGLFKVELIINTNGD